MMLGMKKGFLILLFSLIGCSKPARPVILVTLPLHASFVDLIGGALFSSVVLIPPGANPHSYETKPRQLQRALEAKVWFRFGDPIEEQLLPLFREHKMEVVNLSEAILPNEGGASFNRSDLHLWLDPLLALKQAEIIAKTLSLHFPCYKEQIAKGYEKIGERLISLHQEIVQQLAPFKNRSLLSAHCALTHYCARYGLLQLSIEQGGKEASPHQLSKLTEQALADRVQLIFVEPQHSNKGALLISRSLQIPIYTIDLYGNDYFELMSRLTSAIRNYYGHNGN